MTEIREIRGYPLIKPTDKTTFNFVCPVCNYEDKFPINSKKVKKENENIRVSSRKIAEKVSYFSGSTSTYEDSFGLFTRITLVCQNCGYEKIKGYIDNVKREVSSRIDKFD